MWEGRELVRHPIIPEAIVLLADADAIRIAALRECVTWLAMNCHEFKPDALACEMARDLLKKGDQE